MGLFRPKWKKPDGSVQMGRVWWLEFTDAKGKRRRKSLGVRDKRAAEMVAADMVRRVEMVKAGIPELDGATNAPIAKLVEEYIGEMERMGRSAVHINRTKHHIDKLLHGAVRLAEVTPEFVRRALGRIGRDRTARTVNHYRAALHAFFAWLVLEGRWTINPVASVKRVKEVEKARVRRALSREELIRLIQASPEDRGTCYLLAATTGLRRSEIGALRWCDVDAEGLTVRVKAAYTKNRREAVQPLPPGTLAALLALPPPHEPLAPVFPVVPQTKVLRGDLLRAGIPYETPEGVADFHALRVTYATSLARTGVSLAQAQELMRHSDPKLTANVYTRLELRDGHAAVAGIDVAGGNAPGETGVGSRMPKPQIQALRAQTPPATEPQPRRAV